MTERLLLIAGMVAVALHLSGPSETRASIPGALNSGSFNIGLPIADQERVVLAGPQVLLPGREYEADYRAAIRTTEGEPGRLRMPAPVQMAGIAERLVGFARHLAGVMMAER